MTKTVYVIDDSVSVCFAIERMLRATGLEVLSQRSGEAALRDLEELTPDLVLLDLVLPDIGGLQICSFMRGHPRLAAVPVIIISGIVDDEVRSQSLRIGAVGVLKKPFATEDLVEMVDEVLSREKGISATSPLGAAPLPDPLGSGRLEATLERFAGLGTLRFAALVHASGEIRGFGAAKPDGSAGGELLTAIQRAAIAAAAAGYGDLDLVTLETSDGQLMIQPHDGGWVLAVGFADMADLGKARYLLRRLDLTAPN
ncbi:MAG: response regulator [Acidobacteriota bacterium]